MQLVICSASTGPAKRVTRGDPRGIPYPFDGIGYHLYILQQYYFEPEQQRQAIHSIYRRYVDEMVAVVHNEEGQDRPLYISEIGWPSQDAYGGSAEDLQAENLSVALSLIAEDPKVALGYLVRSAGFQSDDVGRDIRSLPVWRPQHSQPQAGVYSVQSHHARHTHQMNVARIQLLPGGLRG